MRLVICICIVLLFASSCRDKVICPAFQSAYILDDSTRMAYFSYAWKLDQATRDKFLSETYASADTTGTVGVSDPMKYFTHAGNYIQPAEQTSRTKYGIVRYEPMWLKNYERKTAPMENVLSPKVQPEIIPEVYDDVGEFVAEDFSLDSLTAEDSLFVAAVEPEPEVVEPPKKKETKYLYKYDPKDIHNVEQEYYNKYFGKKLIEQPKPQPKPLSKPKPKEVATDSLSSVPQNVTPADSLGLPAEPVVIPSDTTGN